MITGIIRYLEIFYSTKTKIMKRMKELSREEFAFMTGKAMSVDDAHKHDKSGVFVPVRIEQENKHGIPGSGNKAYEVSYPHLQGEPVLQGMRSFCNKDDLLERDDRMTMPVPFASKPFAFFKPLL